MRRHRIDGQPSALEVSDLCHHWDLCVRRAYPWEVATVHALGTRAAIALHRAQIDVVLPRYGAHNPRLFGSVARGEPSGNSDVDVIVDLDPAGGNVLMRLAGLGEEMSAILGVRADVVATDLLRDNVAMTALHDAVPL